MTDNWLPLHTLLTELPARHVAAPSLDALISLAAAGLIPCKSAGKAGYIIRRADIGTIAGTITDLRGQRYG